MKKLFLLSCYTGLHWSDLTTLEGAEIKNGILHKTMQRCAARVRHSGWMDVVRAGASVSVTSANHTPHTHCQPFGKSNTIAEMLSGNPRLFQMVAPHVEGYQKDGNY